MMVILLTSEVAGLEYFFTRFTPFLHQATDSCSSLLRAKTTIQNIRSWPNQLNSPIRMKPLRSSS